MDFDWRELRLVEPLRTLRMIHHSAWIARRWNDPAFPVAFPWFDGAGLLGAADDAAERADRGDARGAAGRARMTEAHGLQPTSSALTRCT